MWQCKERLKVYSNQQVHYAYSYMHGHDQTDIQRSSKLGQSGKASNMMIM